MRLLLITGLPGTGKTTLARRLAERYRAPLIAKDRIKEPLLDALGAGDRAWSRKLSDASFAVQFALVQELQSSRIDVILEGNFRPGEHEQALLPLLSDVRVAQVLCRIEETLRQARLASRRRDPARHRGHGDADPQVAADRSGDAFLDLPGERLVFDNGDPAELIAALDRWWYEHEG
mgnify:CR=1 FL=1